MWAVAADSVKLINGINFDMFRILFGLVGDIFRPLLGISDEFDIMRDIEAICKQVSGSTGGYVAADLSALVREAVELYTLHAQSSVVVKAMSNTLEEAVASQTDEYQLSPRGRIFMERLLEAKEKVPSSCLRGDAVKIPTVSTYF